MKAFDHFYSNFRVLVATTITTEEVITEVIIIITVNIII